jgi:hypothetical protein
MSALPEDVRRASQWLALRAQLQWLYGDPDARIQANAPDVAKWNALGRRKAA